MPRDEGLRPEYEQGWKVTDIFPANSVTVVTSRDHFVLDFDETVLKKRVAAFQETALTDEEVRERFALVDNKGWSVTKARKAIRQDNTWGKDFTRCLYRPFDYRSIFYHEAVIERARFEVMRNMLAGDNLALTTTRQVTSLDFNHVLCTNRIAEYKCISHDRNSYIFPLYLYPAEGEMQFEEGRHPNLNPEFIKDFSGKLGLKFIEDGKEVFYLAFSAAEESVPKKMPSDILRSEVKDATSTLGIKGENLG